MMWLIRLVVQAFMLTSMFALLTNCSGSNGPESGAPPAALAEKLPGKWRATNITIQVADSLAAVQNLAIDAATLSEKPILWEFEAGNRYRATANGTQSRGIWNVFSDTLMLIEPQATYQYFVSFSGEDAFFRALLDWDGDGQEDDHYVGQFKRE
ncbi:MAG: hypothetical protein HUU01_07235 [Saprospiraceae bacterium]|nr:hypothetical protein [Saprospiraceae bacterium]